MSEHEILACSPEPINEVCFNPDWVLPYGLMIGKGIIPKPSG